ncbi:purine-cytosine permease family protein [Flavisphingomonas formosensis]|uniref:purine-cytosine permease family protein n=1 Tax=Flavisphingomonas formosensis TaxID=861534 RepID=UPI0012FA73F9|nr:cytosine permease [Sphingomonas formosensis]
MNDAGDQYAHSPVPEGVTVPGWRVGLIVASFSIGLPDFLNGAHNALALGLWKAALAALLAGVILCIGGCLTAIVSVRSRLLTYLLTRRSFGSGGAALINTVMAFISFCWFGVNASFFGEAIQTAAAINGLPGGTAVYVLFGGVLMTVSTIVGFRSLSRLALFAVPIIGFILAAVLIVTLRTHGLFTAPAPHPPEPMRFGIAVSALLGAYMIAVATMPDLTRFVRSPGGAVVAMAMSFPVAIPAMMTAAAIPALATGETSLMKLVGSLSFGTPLLFLLVLPTWSLNASNLYSASLSLSTTFPAVREWMFTVIGGVIGTLLALVGILEAFIPFALFLGLIIPPIAAIYVIDGFTRFRGKRAKEIDPDARVMRWAAIIVWLGSAGVAALGAYTGWTVTSVPALDATLAAGLGYWTISRWVDPRAPSVAVVQ